MKNYVLWALGTVWMTSSCTNDTSVNEPVSNGATSIAYKLSTPGPQNPANIYDSSGIAYDGILEAYLAADYGYTSIASIAEKVDSIAVANYGPQLLGQENFLPANLEEIEGIVAAPESALDAIIGNSSMTPAAKTSISDFIGSLSLNEDAPYPELHQLIISYEDTVIASSSFTENDKHIILTTTSIARHTMHRRKRRDDKDWDTSVANIAGSVSGVPDNSATAVKMAVVTDIISTNGITE